MQRDALVKVCPVTSKRQQPQGVSVEVLEHLRPPPLRQGTTTGGSSRMAKPVRTVLTTSCAWLRACREPGTDQPNPKPPKR